MPIDLRFNDEQKNIAHGLIHQIDSDEGGMFFENVNQHFYRQVFFDSLLSKGVFFSFLFEDKLRVYIAFDSDTDYPLDEIVSLLRDSMSQSGQKPASVWLRNENRKLINGLQKHFMFNPRGINNSHYESVEYYVKKSNFSTECLPGYAEAEEMSIRGYEDGHIDDYLSLLDAAMTFKNPPPTYRQNKVYFKGRFEALQKRNAFEAFWIDNALIGLYWLDGSTLDHLAVSPAYQRKGFGSRILTRAFAMAFRNPDIDIVKLYCVDWNKQGQAFYKKYGCEISGHSYALTLG